MRKRAGNTPLPQRESPATYRLAPPTEPRLIRSQFAAAAAALVSALVLSAPARAQDTDGGVWTSLTAAAPIAPRLDATMEVHTRFADGAGRLGQLLLRPSVTYKLDDRFTLTAGYAFARNVPESLVRTHEHRIWEQIGYGIVRSDRLILSGRTRLEQRFAEHAGGTGWRLRQQLRAAMPLKRGGKVQALVWNETFVGLNAADWGQRAGIDRTRTFAGLSLPLGTRTTIEPGYLNQAVFRRGRDAMDHLAAVNVFTRF